MCNAQSLSSAIIMCAGFSIFLCSPCCSQPLPEPEPMTTKVPLEMFGDTVMVVEFLNAFGNLFDIKDEFPSGLSFGKNRIIYFMCFYIKLF